MKIEGVTPGLCRKDVHLPRPDGQEPIKLAVTALPIGYLEDLDSLIPSPVPRVVGWARSRGVSGSLLLNKAGKPVPVTDELSPAFKAAQAAANRLQNILILTKGLEGAANVSFDAKPEDFKSTAEYADAIRNEMIAFGLSVGDMAVLVQEILAVSNLTRKRLQEVQDAFLSEEEAAQE